MRPVLLADVETAVRVLLFYPTHQYPQLVRMLLKQADEGDQYRREFGVPHPEFGSGTLMSAAFMHPLAARPPHLDVTACTAFCCIMNALREKQHDQDL